MNSLLLGILVFFGLNNIIRVQTTLIPEANGYEWCITYTDLPENCYIDTTYDVNLLVIKGHRASIKVRGMLDNVPITEFSAPSREFVIDPLFADLDNDCIVGTPDYLELGNNFGNTCQP